MQVGVSTPKNEGEKKSLPPYTIRLCLCRTVQSPANEAPQNSLISCNLREIYFCKRALHIYLKVKSPKRALRHRKKTRALSEEACTCLYRGASSKMITTQGLWKTASSATLSLLLRERSNKASCEEPCTGTCLYREQQGILSATRDHLRLIIFDEAPRYREVQSKYERKHPIMELYFPERKHSPIMETYRERASRQVETQIHAHTNIVTRSRTVDAS